MFQLKNNRNNAYDQLFRVCKHSIIIINKENKRIIQLKVNENTNSAFINLLTLLTFLFALRSLIRHTQEVFISIKALPC